MPEPSTEARADRDAAPLPAKCPHCGGEMQPYDDGEYTSRCEDCGWVRETVPLSRGPGIDR